jgi:HSP20 family protein
MSTLHQLREGFQHVWGNLSDGWQRLYQSAANAMTKFTPSHETETDNKQEAAARSNGWAVIASEVFDDENNIVVRIEAPGMEKDNFDLEVRDGYLVIRGEKHYERETTQGQYRITECAYGKFERAIPLPEEVEANNANAIYKNGILRIELPKSTQNKRKKVTVSVD